MVKAGDVLENPVTGERAVIRRLLVDEPGGERGEVDLYIKPGGAVAGEHVHPSIEEDFTVLKGQVGLRLDGHEMIAPLNQRVRVLPGVAHDLWNAEEEEEAHVFVEASGPEGLRLFELIQNFFGLGQDGKTNSKGLPNLLQAAIVLREFEDVMHITNLPRVVQRVLFGPLAVIARVLGYKGSYPKYTDSDVPSGGKVVGAPSTTEVVARASPIAGALLLSAIVLLGWRRTPKRLTPPSLAETLPLQKTDKGLPHLGKWLPRCLYPTKHSLPGEPLVPLGTWGIDCQAYVS